MKELKFKALSEKERAAINGLFTAYLFYETVPGGREYTCTHCGKTFLQSNAKRTMTANDYYLLSVPHNDEADCPECGIRCKVKNIGKSKGRGNLWEEKRTVVIHRINKNYIQARCYEAVKDYSYSIMPEPVLYEVSRYELRPGRAVKYIYNSYYGWGSTKRHGEPFPVKTNMYGGYCDNSYSVLGIEKLEESFLKYHMLDDYVNEDIKKYNSCIYNVPVMSYLSYFAEYPQIEMLQKLGHYDVVKNLVWQYKKSFPYVNWKAERINDFFKMTKQEYNEFSANGGSLELLRVRRTLNKSLGLLDITGAARVLNFFGSDWYVESFIESMKLYRVPVSDGIKYVMKQKEDSGKVVTLYKDYLSMAQRLKYDLSVHNVMFPKNLNAAHDNAADTERAVLEAKRAEENRKAEQAAKKHLKKYDKLYAFSDGKYIITVPHTAKEIIDEGKAMRHCVGGYAARHLNGTLAILFLRDASAPDKSLYTIEMHGKSLTQVQGYNNRTPLTSEARAFFDCWLSWVQNGSKRNKDGSPVTKKAAIPKTA